MTRRELEASRHYYATQLESEPCLTYRAKLEKALADACEQLRLAQEEEERTQEAMDSMSRTYWEGYTEALEWLIAREGK
jgi:hypothetical protein